MNFALLGGSRALLPVLHAIASDGDHRLSSAALVPDDFTAELLAAAPGTRIESDWEGLLHAEDIDAVIAVASSEVEAPIRQLAAAGKPVLFRPNGDPTSALVYELALVHDDTNVALVPMFVSRHGRDWQALCEAIRGGDLGQIRDIHWTRTIAKDVIPLEQLHAALVHDADTLRQLVGEFDQVTALYVGDRETGLSRGTVTLAGRNLPTATWTIQPGPADAFSLTVLTERGRVTFEAPRAGGTIPSQNDAIQQSGDADLLAMPTEHRDCARAILSHFAGTVSGETAAPTWTDLTRSTEIVEAAERSIRRRRTIDLHFETTSERNQFKSQMTAIGCGLILATLVAVVLLLIVGRLMKPHAIVMQILRIGVFLPLGIFLLLQLLLFLSRPSRSTDAEQEGRNESATRS